jgi:hypothetical protein
MCHQQAQYAAHSDIVDVVPIVFAARYGDQRGAEQRGEREEDACEVGARAVDVALACNEERDVAQSTEGETTVSAREAAPSVVECVVVLLGADFKGDELVRRRAGRGLASRNQIGAGSPDGVLDHVGDEEREDHAYEPAEDCDMGFVCARAHQDGPEDERAQRDSARVYEQPDYTSRLALHARKSAAVNAQTETRSTSACGYPIARLSRKNMR